jgi:hypothetical protein
MAVWHAIVVSAIALGGAVALYGLHRLCLWLEDRGLLYYMREKPESSAASCFVAMQNIVEPPARHTLQVKEEKRHHAEEETPGTRETRFQPGEADIPPA